MVFSSSGILSTNFTQYTTGWKYHRCLFWARYIPELVRTVFQLKLKLNICISQVFFLSFFLLDEFLYYENKQKKLEKIGNFRFLKCKLEKKNCYKVENFLQTLENHQNCIKNPDLNSLWAELFWHVVWNHRMEGRRA